MSAPALDQPRNVCPGFGTPTDCSTPDPVSVVTPERVSATERDTCSLTLTCISTRVATLPRGPHHPPRGGLPTAAQARAVTRPASAVETVGGSKRHGDRIGNGHPPGFALRASLDIPAELPENLRPTQPRQATPVRARERHPAPARSTTTTPSETTNPTMNPSDAPLASPLGVSRENPARASRGAVLTDLGGPAPTDPARIKRVRLVRATERPLSGDDPSRGSQRVLAPLSVVALTCYALTPTYRQTHARLTRERGPASARPCHWCGRRAEEWACLCDHAAVVTGTNSSGKPVTFDPDPAGYVPACRRCHRAHDAARAADRRSPLAIAPRRTRATPARAAVAERAPEPEPLFGADPTQPTGWSIP